MSSTQNTNLLFEQDFISSAVDWLRIHEALLQKVIAFFRNHTADKFIRLSKIVVPFSTVKPIVTLATQQENVFEQEPHRIIDAFGVDVRAVYRFPGRWWGATAYTAVAIP